jgi:hypothetical protein
MRQLVVRTFLFSGVIDKPIPHSVPKYNNPQTHRSISKSVMNAIRVSQLVIVKTRSVSPARKPHPVVGGEIGRKKFTPSIIFRGY